jgi:transcription termination factor nusA
MNNIGLIESFVEFRDERGIDKEELMNIIEDSLKTLLRKRYDSDDHFDVIVNPDKGDFQILLNKVIVEDEMSEDDDLEIELSEARKIDPTLEVGEEFTEEITISQLGRRSILTLKQILAQKFRELSHSKLYADFKDKIGELIVGEVHHTRRSQVIILDEEGNELILDKKNQIGDEFFKKGDTVKAVVESIDFKGNKPLINVSRVSPKFLERLLERDIPEISDNTILLRNVVRIPGEKAKIAVDALDNENIDPVGACVGQKGNRIQGIVRELRGENIDVIQWSQDPKLFIKRALGSSITINEVTINEEDKKALVRTPIEDISKVIGKNGQNIRLAGQLTGYIIDVFRESNEDDDVYLNQFKDEIEEWIIDEFRKANFTTAKEVLKVPTNKLLTLVDLEEETIEEVKGILQAEFED